MGLCVSDGAKKVGRTLRRGLASAVSGLAGSHGPENDSAPLLARSVSLLRNPDRGHALTLGVTTDIPLRSKVSSQVILWEDIYPSQPQGTTSPRSVSTAGPVISTCPFGRNVIVRDPPGTSTWYASAGPSADAATAAAAQAPVPQERVSPTPRSCTRSATC